MPFLGKNEKKIAKEMLLKGYGYVLFSEDAAPLYTPTAQQPNLPVNNTAKVKPPNSVSSLES